MDATVRTDATPRLSFPQQMYNHADFTTPYDTATWETRDAIITDKDGKTVFEQRNVLFPTSWSQTATNVVASKYFRGPLHATDRERSVSDMITRVVQTITQWGIDDHYFSHEDGTTFANELTYLLLHQYGSFNSPVWFNVGIHEQPQCSACFILDVDDSMPAILEWYRQEGLIFQGGSGSGVNVSKIRGSNESLARGGKASGPLSFMRAADASAGAIKSGGVTRRAAKMIHMDIDHPDIMAFITCKHEEERKARALIAAGYDAGIDGDAYATVSFQNTNHSVVVSEAFLRAVEDDDLWILTARTTGLTSETVKARALMRAIAVMTWECGDPGMFYEDTVNTWHTTPSRGPIRGSNPCSEFLRPPDEACNLASLNLLRFLDEGGRFDADSFCHAVNVFITAQEIMVSRASYPTSAIQKNSHAYRTLGLGYANLGAVLMAKGLPYDSEEGRAYAASITALMTGLAYIQSTRLARVAGAFSAFEQNREPMLAVIAKHREVLAHIERAYGTDFPDIPQELLTQIWNDAYNAGEMYGYRNAQVSLLAPVGTISFMMDCSTTGIEPDTSLVSYKKLVGGGTIKHINTVVPRALDTLGYNGQAKEICQHIADQGTIEGAPYIAPAHLPVFDCAFPVTQRGRAIGWEGHVRMVAAVQPFLSGGISKSINMPQDSTVEEIENAYMLGWRLGCKSMAIYRDGCKHTQPVTTHNTEAVTIATTPERVSQPMRRRLPDERAAITHKATIGGHEFYVTVGLYDDGKPGEIFLHMAKEGSTISGLMDSFATAISISLQYGVPLEALIAKFSHMRFEPSGFTKNKEIPMAKSIMDYLFRWLASKFTVGESSAPQATISTEHETLDEDHYRTDAPICGECGSLMTINGSCYKCTNCGGTSGCS